MGTAFRLLDRGGNHPGSGSGSGGGCGGKRRYRVAVEGKLYLCAIKGVCSNRIVGAPMTSTFRVGGDRR